MKTNSTRSSYITTAVLLVGLFALPACVTRSPQQKSSAQFSATAAMHSVAPDFKALYPHVFGGGPIPPASDYPITHLTNTAYDVDYSESRMDPVWSGYYNPEKQAFDLTRPKSQPFSTDTRTTARVTTKDFSQSDYQTNPHAYDRGHMTPSYAIGRGYGKEAQLETFTCSNICPQQKYLNQQTWAALEQVIAVDYAEQFHGVWAIAGPIFPKDQAERLNGKPEIPAAFFYVIVRVDPDGPHALAVIMDQDVSGKKWPLRPFVKTVKEVEAETGLQFFPQLSASERTRLENEEPGDQWNLDRDLTGASDNADS